MLVGDLDPQAHLTVTALQLERVAGDHPSLAAAHGVLIPIQPDDSSVEALRLLLGAERIHYDSRGIISKSDAQAAIIRAGLNHLAEAEASLQPEQPSHV